MSQEPEDVGNVSDVGELPTDPIKGRHARTSSLLAYILVWGLVGFLALYFFTLLWITRDSVDRIETMQDFFNTALPVLTGLAGSAVAYFLSKENRPD